MQTGSQRLCSQPVSLSSTSELSQPTHTRGTGAAWRFTFSTVDRCTPALPYTARPGSISSAMPLGSTPQARSASARPPATAPAYSAGLGVCAGAARSARPVGSPGYE